MKIEKEKAPLVELEEHNPNVQNLIEMERYLLGKVPISKVGGHC